jgi:hypothetical protein
MQEFTFLTETRTSPEVVHLKFVNSILLLSFFSLQQIPVHANHCQIGKLALGFYLVDDGM